MIKEIRVKDPDVSMSAWLVARGNRQAERTSFMKCTAIIAEYNPFHNGHAWQIAEAKRLTGADFILVLMSGDYVQRGAPALFDKHIRTEMALLGGADVVLELPCTFSLGSSPVFAGGAISLLDALGCVNALCFGSEYGEIAPFLSLAGLLLSEPDSFRELLQKNLRSGLSFPAARSKALEEYLKNDPSALPFGQPEELRSFLSRPNNILGLEYCMALLSLNSPIEPVTLLRKGSSYHDQELTSFPSASALRNAVREKKEDRFLSSGVPENVFPVLQSAKEQQGALFEDDFSLLLAAVLQKETRESLASYLDVSVDLANRIYNNRFSCSHFQDFTFLLKTRELTLTRISRALMHILLGIKKAETPSYLRILGFRKSAGPLLKAMSCHSALPIIAKAANADRILPKEAADSFAGGISASLLYETVRSQKYNLPFVHELEKPLIII